RLNDLLELLGLKERKMHLPNQLSGGQQQRVSIGRALMNAPAVMLADEPTGNLDSHTTAQVMNAILKLAREKNITFVMVTHERDLAGCADRIITIKDGMVLRNEKIENPNMVFEAQESVMDKEYALAEEEALTKVTAANTLKVTEKQENATKA
ncbi:MAG: ATP-binding cassette domain-containing protein, partial [Oscillospiraceae bacterium]